MRVPFIDRTAISKLADDVRDQHWSRRSFPINMEKIIESKYNLELIPFYGLKEACGGDAFLKTDFTGIVIDGKQYTDARYANRLRFSLAHELGHYVLHKEYYRDINIKTVEDYKYYTTTIDERDWKALEWQANEFVSNPKTYLTLTKLL